jgi:hypothetical protein
MAAFRGKPAPKTLGDGVKTGTGSDVSVYGDASSVEPGESTVFSGGGWGGWNGEEQSESSEGEGGPGGGIIGVTIISRRE